LPFTSYLSCLNELSHCLQNELLELLRSIIHHWAFNAPQCLSVNFDAICNEITSLIIVVVYIVIVYEKYVTVFVSNEYIPFIALVTGLVNKI